MPARQTSRSLALVLLAGLMLGTDYGAHTHAVRAAEPTAAEPETKSSDDAAASEPTGEKVLLSGQVILLAEALKARGIKFYAAELQGAVVLETKAGEIVPLISDWRGRAFYQDERLRHRPVDLVVRRTPGLPFVQVLMVYTFNDKEIREYTDYWCDICAIPMYEIKDCECCQGPPASATKSRTCRSICS